MIDRKVNQQQQGRDTGQTYVPQPEAVDVTLTITSSAIQV